MADTHDLSSIRINSFEESVRASERPSTTLPEGWFECGKCRTIYNASMVLGVKFQFSDKFYCEGCSDKVLLEHLGEKEFKKFRIGVLGPSMDDIFDPHKEEKQNELEEL